MNADVWMILLALVSFPGLILLYVVVRLLKHWYRFQFKFVEYDRWIGMYIDRPNRRWYIALLPCLVLIVEKRAKLSVRWEMEKVDPNEIAEWCKSMADVDVQKAITAATSTPKFTPGPWFASTGIADHYMIRAQVRDGEHKGKWFLVGYTAERGNLEQKSLTFYPVARTPEEDEANAYVQAASPELYNALEDLHNDVAEYQRLNQLGGYDNHCMVRARAALEKARGIYERK